MMIPNQTTPIHRQSFLSASALGLATVLGVATLPIQSARACGCVSPPVVDEGDFAVNQQAEQIIFEVGDGEVTAHVLIRYAGKPKEFAWIVPVPDIPDLDISPASVFSLIESATAPDVRVHNTSYCPQNEYRCNYLPWCSDESTTTGDDDTDEELGTAGDSWGDDNTGGTGDSDIPGIDVHKHEIVGDYEIFVFSADEATTAVDWLKSEDFVVNDTMTPYMRPYIEADMALVAVKLLDGAGSDAIRPLQMTYPADAPMIPLQLTAVAAEPHLAVVAYIYGQNNYRPLHQEVVELDESQLSRGNDVGTNNYPTLLTRAIDEAGGEAFVAEYYGTAPKPRQNNDSSGCCRGEDDWCGISDDGACQCPGAEFDRSDCNEVGDIVEGWTLMESLAEKHARLSRLITRLSPEEMSFDPVFIDMPNTNFRQRLRGEFPELRSCRADIVDIATYDRIEVRSDCATTYCDQGDCVIAEGERVGCACRAGHVARQYIELDGRNALTCVPEEGTVVLDLDVPLPDACTGLNCGLGRCIDVGGFPSCECDNGAAATLRNDSPIPVCVPALELPTGDPGGYNQRTEVRELEVCKPPVPECGPRGWLTTREVDRVGVACDDWIGPDPSDMIKPDNDCVDPDAEDSGMQDDGTSTGDSSGDTTSGMGSEGIHTSDSTGSSDSSGNSSSTTSGGSSSTGDDFDSATSSGASSASGAGSSGSAFDESGDPAEDASEEGCRSGAAPGGPMSLMFLGLVAGLRLRREHGNE